MATSRQKEAARENIAKAREVQSERAHGAKIPRQTRGLSTAQQDKLPDKDFAFPKERKEPLVDARHVRNAIARFDQVEGVTDAERDKAWKRILAAAKKYDVAVSESSWHDLAEGGDDSKASPKSSTRAKTGTKTSSRTSAKTSPKASTRTAAKTSPKTSPKTSAKTGTKSSAKSSTRTSAKPKS
jgi:hypothetical protein